MTILRMSSCRQWIWFVLMTLTGHLSIADDFNTNSLSKYLTTGEIRWERNSVEMSRGASLGKAVALKPEFQVNLISESTSADFSIRLVFEGVLGEAVLSFDQAGKSSELERDAIKIAVDYEGTQLEGEPVQTLSRTATLERVTANAIQVDFSFGLIEVRVGKPNAKVFRAFLPTEAAAVKRVYVEAGGSTLRLREFSVTGQPKAVYTADQLADLEEARVLDGGAPGGILAGRLQAYFESGQLDRARETCNRAFALREQVFGRDSIEAALASSSLCFWQLELGDTAAAIETAERARDILIDKLGPLHPALGHSLNALSICAMDVSDFSQADALLQRFETIFRRVANEQSIELAALYHNRSFCLRSLGRREEAFEMLKKCVACQRSAFNEESPLSQGLAEFANSLDALGGLYLSSEDFIRAAELIEESLRIRERLAGGKRGTDYALSSLSLAKVMLAQGEEDRARELLNFAVKELKVSVGPDQHWYHDALLTLADFEASAGNNAVAHPLIVEAFGAQIRAAKRTLPGVSLAEGLKFTKQTLAVTSRLLSSYRSQENATDLDVYQVCWDSKALLARSRLGLLLGNDSPNASAARGQLQNLRSQIGAAALRGTSSPGKMNEWLQQKEQLERSLARESQPSERLLRIRDASLEHLAQALPGNVTLVDFMSSYQVESNSLSKEERVRLVSQGGVGRIGSLTYDAFVLSKQNGQLFCKWIPLGDRQSIDNAISEWRTSLTLLTDQRGLGKTAPKTLPQQTQGAKSAGGAAKGLAAAIREIDGEASQSAAVLFKLVWQKIAPHISTEHVVLVPEGELHRIPWGALPGVEGEDTYLIEKHALSTLNYAQQIVGLESMDDGSHRADKLLVIGGVDFGRLSDESAVPNEQTYASRAGVAAGWQQLPGTRTEVGRIGEIWGDSASLTLLSGGQATEEQVRIKIAEASYIHFATHGFFEQESRVFSNAIREQSAFAASVGDGESIAKRNPFLTSGLVLANANLLRVNSGADSDGVLTAEEILGLSLTEAKLVVLSACETGLGDVAAGEGILGLQRAFHDAGSDAVIASLWKVDDFATKALMGMFYENLWEQNESKLAALRTAQLKLIRQYEPIQRKTVDEVQPVKLPAWYWAAFQLGGDWR